MRNREPGLVWCLEPINREGTVSLRCALYGPLFCSNVRLDILAAQGKLLELDSNYSFRRTVKVKEQNENNANRV